MVETAVIETASENSSTQLSTSVYCLLRFPRAVAGNQAKAVGSSEFMTVSGTKYGSRSPLVDALC